MRIRFVPKQVDTRWRVYDTFRGSFPVQRADVGLVAQDLPTEADAQKEAVRLNLLGISGDAEWKAARAHAVRKFGVQDDD